MPAWHGQPQKTRYAFTVSGSATVFGGAANNPPVWQNVPHITFFVGITSTFPISGTYQSNNYVTDADFDTIVITKNNVFVQGVSWDGGKFTSNGTGSQTTVTGHILTADDGHNSNVTSSVFQIAIIPGAISWTSVPSVSFVEGSTSSYSFGQNVLNYSAATDEFRVTPGYTLSAWISLTGTGNVNLTPSGAQVDGDDFDDTPGIKIDVRRSGGAWVSSAAFGVTVNVASAINYSSTYTFPSPTVTYQSTTKQLRFGKHNVFRFCPLDGMIWQYGGDNANNPWTTFFDVMTIARYSARLGTWEEMYPFFGVSGKEFPGYRGFTQFVWDSRRQVFWSCAGSESDAHGGDLDSKYVGTVTTGFIWKFDPKVAQADRYVKGIARNTTYTFSEGNCGDYDASRDRIYWLKDNHLVYLQCNDNPLLASFGSIALSGISGLDVGQSAGYFDAHVDVINDELLWFFGKNYGSNLGRIYATNLGTGVTRIVATPPALEVPLGRGSWDNDETPMAWVPSRRQLVLFYGGYALSGGTDVDAVGGLRLVDVDTGAVTVGPDLPNSNKSHTMACYDPIEDVIVSVTNTISNDTPEALKFNGWTWTQPTWASSNAVGQVVAVTTNMTTSAGVNPCTAEPTGSCVYSSANKLAKIPENQYGGSFFSEDYEEWGGFGNHGGGDGNWMGSAPFVADLGTQLWRCIGTPEERSTNFGGTNRIVDPHYVSAWGEYGIAGTDPYPVEGGTMKIATAHNYDAPSWLPRSMGGGQNGSFCIFRRVKTYQDGGVDAAHRIELVNGLTYRAASATGISAVHVGSERQPAVALDEARRCFWYLLCENDWGYSATSMGKFSFSDMTGIGVHSSISLGISSPLPARPCLLKWLEGDALVMVGGNSGVYGAYMAVYRFSQPSLGFQAVTFSGDSFLESPGVYSYSGAGFACDGDSLWVAPTGTINGGAGNIDTLYKVTPSTSSNTWAVQRITLSGSGLGPKSGSGMWKSLNFSRKTGHLLAWTRGNLPLYGYKVRSRA